VSRLCSPIESEQLRAIEKKLSEAAKKAADTAFDRAANRSGSTGKPTAIMTEDELDAIELAAFDSLTDAERQLWLDPNCTKSQAYTFETCCLPLMEELEACKQKHNIADDDDDTDNDNTASADNIKSDNTGTNTNAGDSSASRSS
jgi:hypothetical protein